MKTTLELPDELMRRVNLQAVHRGQILKDVIAQLLEIGLAVTADTEKVPRAPEPLRLRGCSPLVVDDIQAATRNGRE